MAFSRYMCLLAILVYSLQYVSCEENVPVFMWGVLQRSPERINPFAIARETELDYFFGNVIDEKTFTVVFIEQNLSVEDFSRHLPDGEAAFPFLQQYIPVSVYIPSAEYPLNVLHKFASGKELHHIKYTEQGLSKVIEPEGGKFVFILLEDQVVGETREDLLRRHNTVMENIFSDYLKQYETVAGIYTGRHPSLEVDLDQHIRVRREVETSEATGLYDFDDLLLYVETISVQDGVNARALEPSISYESKYNSTTDTIEATIKFPNSTTVWLYLTQTDGYWFLNNAKLEITRNDTTVVEELEGSEVYAASGFSYNCGQDTTFLATNDSTLGILLNNMQIQPYFNKTKTETKFGEPFYCVGFTSVPIWSGLFVVFILLSITFYGIMMMMDIRAMDRFDDPKGRTININASE